MSTPTKPILRADEVAEVQDSSLARVAHVISNLFSPPVLGAVGAIIAIYPTYNWTTWSWVITYMVLNIVLPTGYIFYLLARGEVSDMHLRIRSERFKPAVVMIIMGIFTCVWEILGDAPYWLIAMAIAQLIQAVALFLITLRYKVSAHTATATAVSGIGALVLGPAGWLLFLLIPIVMWARISIKRHTLNQTLAGFLLGFASVVMTLYLMAWL